MDQSQILTPDPRKRLVSTDPRLRSSQRQPLMFNAPQRSNLRRSNITQSTIYLSILNARSCPRPLVNPEDVRYIDVRYIDVRYIDVRYIDVRYKSINQGT